ncbi:hypothetical protein [Spirochaeta isovalerica]|uniref:Uncharacterized protein n=1 Tax=Spirochaeta isovalerica TaxID=150 RepID=A0A841RB06_9SPIO|nr:hypothetical protein [Spirochaeta isovalerica]MBB6482574.1 hypothetical protein [Spirochaeta isovalerica]
MDQEEFREYVSNQRAHVLGRRGRIVGFPYMELNRFQSYKETFTFDLVNAPIWGLKLYDDNHQNQHAISPLIDGHYLPPGSVRPIGFSGKNKSGGFPICKSQFERIRLFDERCIEHWIMGTVELYDKVEAFVFFPFYSLSEKNSSDPNQFNTDDLENIINYRFDFPTIPLEPKEWLNEFHKSKDNMFFFNPPKLKIYSKVIRLSNLDNQMVLKIPEHFFIQTKTDYLLQKDYRSSDMNLLNEIGRNVLSKLEDQLPRHGAYLPYCTDLGVFVYIRAPLFLDQDIFDKNLTFADLSTVEIFRPENKQFRVYQP